MAKEVAVFLGHESAVRRATFSPDGMHVISASDDGTVRLWDTSMPLETAILRHDGQVRTATFSPDGKHVVTASDDSSARLWDAETGKQIAVLRGQEGTVSGAVFRRMAPTSSLVRLTRWHGCGMCRRPKKSQSSTAR
jgi:WD40 repeat protein